jgi:flagellar hook-associated protein 3 FlgL
MRISNKMMTDMIQTNLSKLSRQMANCQQMIATGKKINKASDDPIGMGGVLGYRSGISAMSQYLRTIDQCKVRMELAETVLDTVESLVTQAKEIAGDTGVANRGIWSAQTETIRRQILELANSRLNGNYLFSGNKSSTVAFDAAGVYQGDSGKKTYLIGDGITVEMEADGSQIFQGGADVFAALDDLKTALDSGDAPAISSQQVALAAVVDRIQAVRAKNASIYSRLEKTATHLTGLKGTVEDLLSGVEGADLEKVIIDFKTQETAYEASLAVSAQIIQKSLIDFLR